LFDIGVAGPIVGFVLSVPALIWGLSLSKVVPSLPSEQSLVFGEPLLLKIVSSILFQGISDNHDIILHPVAFAGWVGILVTALNLFPIGQLDGGHVFYALLGPRTRKYSRWILLAFIVMGVFFWVGWFVWALLISFLGLKHPRIIDEDVPLSGGRKSIGILVFIIFIFSFIPDPIKGYDLLSLIKQFHF
jgi:membrane-associated protease RseP (regulator of RpoE activity)